MGNCLITGARTHLKVHDPKQQRNSMIEKQLKLDAAAHSKIHKLLLLGPGESGKSTIFKQIRFLYQSGFSDEEREEWTPFIFFNLLHSMKVLLDGRKVFAEKENGFEFMTDNSKDSAVQFLEVYSDWEAGNWDLEYVQQVGLNLKNAMESLWSDPAIQSVYTRSSQLQLPDCAAFFLDNLERISQEDYVPTKEDILYARVKTTSVAESVFRLNENRGGELYKIVDVGGQRNERRKWIHQFDGVQAVIFCVALSEYDQVLVEDEGVNRMIETRDLLSSLLQRDGFEGTSFLVFLNKFDLFEKKVLQASLTTCDWFSDYVPTGSGVSEVEHAYKFVEAKFVELFKQCTARGNTVRVFRTYRTTAIDEDNMRHTFNDVEKALRSMLEQAKERQRLVSAGILATGIQVN